MTTSGLFMTNAKCPKCLNVSCGALLAVEAVDKPPLLRECRVVAVLGGDALGAVISAVQTQVIARVLDHLLPVVLQPLLREKNRKKGTITVVFSRDLT